MSKSSHLEMLATLAAFAVPERNPRSVGRIVPLEGPPQAEESRPETKRDRQRAKRKRLKRRLKGGKG